MNHEKEIRFIEMFSGIGGFRLGLERANNIEQTRFSKEPKQEECTQGRKRITNEPRPLFFSGQKPSFRCVWSNENDKYACQIYRKNFGSEELVEANIKTINPNTIPDFDLLTAGFPCQAFSVAGKRKGFQDTRGTLFYDIIRVAEAKRPELLLLENVKGLLSHDEGLTFQIIIESLEELGYLVEWQVLNSKYFGVPQNRERVFIVGHFRGESGCQIFPIGNSNKISSEKYESKNICPTITSRYYKRGKTDPYIATNLMKVGNVYEKGQDGIVYDIAGVSPTLRSHKTGGTQEPLIVGLMTQERVIPKIAQSLQTDGFLRSGCSWGTTKPQSARNIRRLTPVECERLQGFPDGWTEWGIDENGKKVRISDTQRYKVLGNAVSVPVITFLGNLLLSNYRVAVNGY